MVTLLLTNAWIVKDPSGAPSTIHVPYLKRKTSVHLTSKHDTKNRVKGERGEDGGGGVC